jgi:predicted nucleotidyltransferase
MPVTPQEAAATMRRRSADARLAAERYAGSLRDQAVALVRRHLPAGGKAWLIGSLVWGGFGVRSDVDLVLAQVDGQTATSIEVALCTALGLEIDLLSFESLPASFRERIEREGLAIHGGCGSDGTAPFRPWPRSTWTGRPRSGSGESGERVVSLRAEKIMAQTRSPVEQVLRQIDRMSEEQQCELLEAMLLKQRRSDIGWGMIKRIRSTLPRRSEQQVKRDVDTAIQQVRRDQSRTARA